MNPHTKRLMYDAARHDREARALLERRRRNHRRNMRRQEIARYLERRAA